MVSGPPFGAAAAKTAKSETALATNGSALKQGPVFWWGPAGSIPTNFRSSPAAPAAVLLTCRSHPGAPAASLPTFTAVMAYDFREMHVYPRAPFPKATFLHRCPDTFTGCGTHPSLLPPHLSLLVGDARRGGGPPALNSYEPDPTRAPMEGAERPRRKGLKIIWKFPLWDTRPHGNPAGRGCQRGVNQTGIAWSWPRGDARQKSKFGPHDFRTF